MYRELVRMMDDHTVWFRELLDLCIIKTIPREVFQPYPNGVDLRYWVRNNFIRASLAADVEDETTLAQGLLYPNRDFDDVDHLMYDADSESSSIHSDRATGSSMFDPIYVSP